MMVVNNPLLGKRGIGGNPWISMISSGLVSELPCAHTQTWEFQSIPQTQTLKTAATWNIWNHVRKSSGYFSASCRQWYHTWRGTSCKQFLSRVISCLNGCMSSFNQAQEFDDVEMTSMVFFIGVWITQEGLCPPFRSYKPSRNVRTRLFFYVVLYVMMTSWLFWIEPSVVPFLKILFVRRNATRNATRCRPSQ